MGIYVECMPAIGPSLRSCVGLSRLSKRTRKTTLGWRDIAAAVGVTPRSVQYMFRRHLGTTPLEYLRRLRLDRAHRDLQAADPSVDTVTAIAGRWGFSHAGRFSIAYKQVYGIKPSRTLRD